jgi:hypothetical protein
VKNGQLVDWKNKPKTKPKQTQTNPNPKMPKMNLNNCPTMAYIKKPPTAEIKTNPKQTQTNPIALMSYYLLERQKKLIIHK